MKSGSLASGQYFWKVQYTVRNKEFQLQADAVAEMERAFGRLYGFDDPWDEANLHKPEFEQFADDCRKSGCWEVATNIYDEFHVSCMPRPDILNVLELLESGESCSLHYFPPFYQHAFVIDETTCLSKKEGRNSLTISIDVDSPVGVINGDVSALIRVAKEAVKSGESFKDSFNANWSKFRKTSPIDNVARAEGQYKREGDSARAVGMWIWDYANSSDSPKAHGVIAEAIREFQRRYDDGRFQIYTGSADDDALRKLFNNARKCIEKTTVFKL